MDAPDVTTETGQQPEPLKVDPLKLTQRFTSEGRWREIQPVRDQMFRECRQRGMSKEQAQQWVYAELDRMYPALVAGGHDQSPSGHDQRPGDNDSLTDDEARVRAHAHAREGRLQGLDAIPETWPQLPGNATLAAELSWVQAERLRIVEEKPSGAVVVHLDRAGSPAPSWAALSWLETSIRSYAKFVDICAKGLAGQDLESDMIKRERRSIEDVRRLLAEMLPPSS